MEVQSARLLMGILSSIQKRKVATYSICYQPPRATQRLKKTKLVPHSQRNSDWVDHKQEHEIIGPEEKEFLKKAINTRKVHLLAINEVESKAEIQTIRNVIGNRGKNIRILAKIQTLTALRNIDEILEEANGIIISRGTLGCYFSHQDVIYIQKYVTQRCNIAGKPVLLSTSTLPTMVD